MALASHLAPPGPLNRSMNLSRIGVPAPSQTLRFFQIQPPRTKQRANSNVHKSIPWRVTILSEPRALFVIY